MGKGYQGQTCGEALKDVITSLGKLTSAQDIFDEVKKKGSWKDDAIWQEFMARTVNLPPSYIHYPNVFLQHRFLFMRENGDYEYYNPSVHGKFQQGRRVTP